MEFIEEREEDALYALVAELKGESIKLRDALAEYGRHPYWCASYGVADKYTVTLGHPCDCGLNAALAETEKGR